MATDRRRQRALLICGPMNDDDMAFLAAAMRAIERQNPTATYRLVNMDLERELTALEAAQMLDKTFPRTPEIDMGPIVHIKREEPEK